MSEIDRKALRREYKDTPRPAGLFRIRNTVTGKSLVGSSPDLPGMLNRQRFQLQNGSHPDKELQREWNELGGVAFEVDVLDRLEPKKEPGYDPTQDLRVLKDMWIQKFVAAGVPLYAHSRRGA